MLCSPSISRISTAASNFTTTATSNADAVIWNLDRYFKSDMASPAHWKKLYDAVPSSVTDSKERSKQAWDAFARNASGTGPWKMDKFVPRERLELVKYTGYWDAKRVPKVDRLVLLPMPEPNARTAALLSGQVDWIEAPSPDAVPARSRWRRGSCYSTKQSRHWTSRSRRRFSIFFSTSRTISA
jgi:peptide/nickel transport system substrate-binding protein